MLKFAIERIFKWPLLYHRFPNSVVRVLSGCESFHVLRTGSSLMKAKDNNQSLKFTHSASRKKWHFVYHKKMEEEGNYTCLSALESIVDVFLARLWIMQDRFPRSPDMPINEKLLPLLITKVGKIYTFKDGRKRGGRMDLTSRETNPLAPSILLFLYFVS